MKTTTKHYILPISALALALGCDVESNSSDNQGLGSLTHKTPDAAADTGADTGSHLAPAARGYVVVESDYSASNVSIFDADGNLLLESLLSSGSKDPGLSAPLSGDVVAPTSAMSGDEIVLLDRKNGVLNWVNLETAEVRQQVNVGPGGFDANPYDYVPYDAHTAFVTRFKTNGVAGQAEYDSGGDVLVLDPTTGELKGEIDLRGAFEGDAPPPTPTRAVMAGGLLRVTLIGYDGTTFADARLVTIDPETLAISNVLVFEGVQNCTNLALAPNGESLALGCSGPYTPDAVDHSAVIQVSVAEEPVELLRVPGAELGNEQVNIVEFVTNTTLALTTFGRFDDEYKVVAPDTLRLLDLSTGEADPNPVVDSAEAAYVLNEVRCIQAVHRCVLTDAATNGGQLRRFDITDTGRLEELSQVSEEQLPPRSLGLY